MFISTDEEDIFQLIEKARRGDTVRMIGIGASMRPLLKDGRDFIDLVAVRDDTIIKKNDVVFYKSHEGLYVLHRILSVTSEGYYPNGDGNLLLEPLLKRENIYLMAVGFIRKGRYIPTGALMYRLYSAVWTLLRPMRGFIFRWYGRFRRLLTRQI
jgi:hypothetical protein